MQTQSEVFTIHLEKYGETVALVHEIEEIKATLLEYPSFLTSRFPTLANLLHKIKYDEED